MIVAATSSASNFDSAIARLAAPILAKRDESASMSNIASASAGAFLMGTRRPFTPSCTVSRQPLASVVTMARPMDIASSVE